MRLVQDGRSNVNVIRGYGPGELRINDEVFRGSLLVGPTSIVARPDLLAASDLRAEHAAAILDLQPELVLVGTGRRQEFPVAAFAARFLAAGIGFEVMDTGAACRTFNVLVGERRQVVALLML